MVKLVSSRSGTLGQGIFTLMPSVPAVINEWARVVRSSRAYTNCLGRCRIKSNNKAVILSHNKYVKFHKRLRVTDASIGLPSHKINMPCSFFKFLFGLIVGLVVGPLGAAHPLGSQEQDAASPKRPFNVLFIISDDLTANALSCPSLQ